MRERASGNLQLFYFNKNSYFELVVNPASLALKVYIMDKLHVNGWQKHQSFRKDRGTPPWIKLHRNLFMKPNWVALSDAEKGQLISMWILAADDDGSIPADAKVLRKLCQLDDLPDIKKFINLQWLSVDDNHLTPTCQPDDNHLTPQRREEESRIEENRKEKKEIDKVKMKAMFPLVDVDLEFEKFNDYIASKGKRYKDKPAGFRNWCRNAEQWSNKNANIRPNNQYHKPTQAEQIAAGIERLNAEFGGDLQT